MELCTNIITIIAKAHVRRIGGGVIVPNAIKIYRAVSLSANDTRRIVVPRVWDCGGVAQSSPRAAPSLLLPVFAEQSTVTIHSDKEVVVSAIYVERCRNLRISVYVRGEGEAGRKGTRVAGEGVRYGFWEASLVDKGETVCLPLREAEQIIVWSL